MDDRHQARKPFRSGWYAQGWYLYGKSQTVNDGGSSQARSNWINNYFGLSGVNDVPVAMSNFSPGHRITLSAIYTLPMGPTEASFSAYYNGQTGRPYAYRYSNDVNVDQGATNDLFYIPRDADDVIIANGTFDQLMAFVNDGCERAHARDHRRAQLLPRAVVQLDGLRRGVSSADGPLPGRDQLNLQNLINAFDSGNGLVEYATFNGIAPVSAAVDAPTGKWRYTLNNVVLAPETNPRFSRDDLRSRWQGQLGFNSRF